MSTDARPSGLPTAFDTLVSWFTEEALPFWHERAFDREWLGFAEHVSHDNQTMYDAPRRIRVLARQVYVYARATTLGLYGESAVAAHDAFKALSSYVTGSGEARSVPHVLAKQPENASDKRDAYDHAFVILACAEYIRAFGADEALALAKQVDAFMQGLAHEAGGYAEDDLRSYPRRQNPHMHLFEAYTALHSATGNATYRSRVEAIQALFDQYFLDRDESVVREFFDETFRLDPEKGAIVEPGHAMEWIWLLDAAGYAEHETDRDVLRQLFAKAEETGLTNDRPLLRDMFFLGADQPPATFRTWPQTEYARACLVRARWGDAGMIEKAEGVVQELLSLYCHQEIRGAYFDQLSENGTVISKVMPTSTMYHWMTLVDEICRFKALPKVDG
ncbi:MAG: AGE family epimerase/isomerase [Parvularculaceae bacterium]|nr:AGE family epimerase/isomerase [Parvularculaceae bacterium]